MGHLFFTIAGFSLIQSAWSYVRSHRESDKVLQTELDHIRQAFAQNCFWVNQFTGVCLAVSSHQSLLSYISMIFVQFLKYKSLIPSSEKCNTHQQIFAKVWVGMNNDQNLCLFFIKYSCWHGQACLVTCRHVTKNRVIRLAVNCVASHQSKQFHISRPIHAEAWENQKPWNCSASLEKQKPSLGETGLGEPNWKWRHQPKVCSRLVAPRFQFPQKGYIWVNT